ncbi:hypothetical protein ACQ7CX_22330 [Chryseobacterium arthrosphaerae]|uniref:hypothetical protein n=1 Tax=Chryseobacterium arthrosphaerae TaxID=651561 RepID=UPI001BB09FB4|nr:hypothetical protein [Chryseobacterium arthrosphaerae]QUY55053.1 hypothetical protein I2F65_19590 [Chryseobacterium arthrosphaerae]
MNPRVLELIKNPKNIQSEDLGLLKEEIHAFPYIQNIRALHLYGVHLYEKENYQKELSVTAAYTTDKKILYQLINGKIRQETKKEPAVEAHPSKTVEKTTQFAYKSKAFPIKREEEITAEEKAKEEVNACILPISHDVKPVFVNGERNRILFEGEENFLDEENSETIDIESTLESGTLVTQKAEPVQNTEQIQAETNENTGENFSPETVINEDEVLSESETAKVEEEENVSFQEVEPLLPEVEIEDNAEENTHTENADKENEVSSESGEEKAENVTLHEAESTLPEVNAEENAGENFSPEIVINEDEISSGPEETKVEQEDNTSFQEIESILPEVTIEDNTSEKKSDAEPVTGNKEISASETALQAEESDAEISFHGTETFLPDVKIQTSSDEISQSAEISQPTPGINKHEEEMRRLIEEVEKKMKQTKSAPQKEEETESVPDHEISFAETQSFHFWSNSEESSALEEVKTEETVQEEQSEVQAQKPEPAAAEEPKEEIITEEIPETQTTTWKPMSVESNMPDSLISKTVESQPSVSGEPVKEIPAADEKPVIPTEEKVAEISEEASEKETIPAAEEVSDTADKAQKTDHLTESVPVVKDEEVPVMNVSFFGTDISSLSVEEKQKENKKEPAAENPAQEITMKNPSQPLADSNVPGFINTWQSWLKIDRTEEIEKEKEVIKEKAIENFIENNPKISQLKEESTYVVKEKNDDISHLMTETLANLYFEQKLYSKAVKAFEILKKKYPEKADYFNAKIKEVNDSKSGK